MTASIVLNIKNVSRQPIFVPRHINCFDDSGFGSDRYVIDRTDVLAPGKTKQVPVHIYETSRAQLRKEGFFTLFMADSAEVHVPIKTKSPLCGAGYSYKKMRIF